MHAVARLALHPQIDNIQTSWVKMGRAGALRCLDAGCNDLGGSLMDESITRAAGATHGCEFSPKGMREAIAAIGRRPMHRTTLYAPVSPERTRRAENAGPLTERFEPSAGRRARIAGTPRFSQISLLVGEMAAP